MPRNLIFFIKTRINLSDGNVTSKARVYDFGKKYPLAIATPKKTSRIKQVKIFIKNDLWRYLIILGSLFYILGLNGILLISATIATCTLWGYIILYLEEKRSRNKIHIVPD